MLEACQLTASAMKMMSEAHTKYAEAEKQVITVCTCANAKIHETRQLHSRESSRLRHKLDEKLKKHDQEHKSAIKLDCKYYTPKSVQYLMHVGHKLTLALF